jgi:pimeloyl-ACP methyl ester carboxylesterase
MLKFEERTAEISHRGARYSIAYHLRPQPRPAFVYLHGLGSTKDDFLEAFESPSFSDSTLLAFDFPGSGESSYPEELELAMPDLVEITAELIRQLGLEDITLIGHSMGGLVGLLYADAYPERVRRFINIEGNLAPEDCGVFSRRSSEYPSRVNPHKYFERVVDATAASEQAGYRAFARGFRSQVKPQAFFDYCRSIVAYSDYQPLLDRFTALRAQTLFIHGEENSALTYLPRLRQEGVAIASIAASSHFPVITNPSQLFQTIAAFVESPQSADHRSSNRTKLNATLRRETRCC